MRILYYFIIEKLITFLIHDSSLLKVCSVDFDLYFS